MSKLRRHSVALPADLLALIHARAVLAQRSFNQEIICLLTGGLPAAESSRLHHVKRQEFVLAEAERTLTESLADSLFP